MYQNIGKKSMKTARLGVLFNFGEILDLLKTDSNISWGSEECSVNV